MRKISILLATVLSALMLTAQERNFWTATSEARVGKNIFADRSRPDNYLLFQLNDASLRSQLNGIPSEKQVRVSASSFILSVPSADGKLERFRIVEASSMEPALAARYPGIRSYAGIGVDDPSATLRFAFSQQGFSGTIFSSNQSTVFIERVDNVTSSYLITRKNNYRQTSDFTCLTNDIVKSSGAPSIQLRNADDGKFRTLRLAMTCDGEFGDAFDGGASTEEDRKANVLAKFNSLLTRCNGIFEKDFGLRLLLIANEADIIYLDASSDSWMGGNLNTETQSAITGPIPNSDYDIGHAVLMRGGNSGNAGCIGCICSDGNKGKGFTGLANASFWNSDAFVIDYLPHEMGHQLGGNHTFTHADEGPTVAQVEPGSGTTIMGYAGITGPNDVAAHSHDNFHAISIQQITDNLKSKSCVSSSSSGNSTPAANAGSDFTIPRSTPFRLTGSGSDADAGDVLSYVWEQMDVPPASGIPWFPSTTATSGPAFRCFAPLNSPSRTFPSLAFILNGTNTDKWEKLSDVGRTLNFRFTVRDNHPGVGANNSDDMVVTVDGSSGPFAVTSPNSAVTWCPGVHTVTWDVAGTDGGAVNTDHVNILLSTDGGNTFTTLVANTDNDGSQDVTISCGWSNRARIKVEAVGNIFFDISNADFTVGDNTPPTFTAPGDIVIVKDANCNYNAASTVTGDVTDENDNCSSGLNATFSDVVMPGTCVGETIIKRTWRLQDNCLNVTTRVQTITIRDVTAPTFTAPPNTVIFADASCGYDASPSITGDVTDEADNCDHTLDAGYSDVTVNGSCIGEKIITRTWTLTDDCGNSTSHTQTIMVKDITPPVISNVSANPNTLWSPNHKMYDVEIKYIAKDNCSPVTSTLSVSSNEPINGSGDGNTSPDWQVIDNHHVKLRAERSGNGSGRIYTITITSRDDCGNTSTANVTVVVSHDQSLTRIQNESGAGLEISVAPNPSRKGFTLRAFSNDTRTTINLQVSDQLGRIIETRKVAEGVPVTIGVLYRPGSYYVRAIQGRQHATVKLIKLTD